MHCFALCAEIVRTFLLSLQQCEITLIKVLQKLQTTQHKHDTQTHTHHPSIYFDLFCCAAGAHNIHMDSIGTHTQFYFTKKGQKKYAIFLIISKNFFFIKWSITNSPFKSDYRCFYVLFLSFLLLLSCTRTKLSCYFFFTSNLITN